MVEIIQKNKDLGKQQDQQKQVLDDEKNGIEVIYLYQLWSGANKFFCQGRIITGPKSMPFLVASFLILIPIIMVIIFFIEHRLVVFILSILVFYLKFRVSFSDPGIVDRLNNTFQDDEDIKMIPQKSYSSQLQGICIADTNGHLQQFRQCETCQIYKNKEMKHCRQCDNCVCKFDHHCVWLNNCIGKRNYTNFILFLICLQSLIVYTIYLSFKYIIDDTNKIANEQFITKSVALSKVLSHQPLSIILIIYGIIFLLLVSTLFFFHVYLLFSSLTTFEFTKIKKGFKNYFSLSFIETFNNKFGLQNMRCSLDFRKKIIIRTKKNPKENMQVQNNSIILASTVLADSSQKQSNLNQKSSYQETPCPIILQKSLVLNANVDKSEAQIKEQDVILQKDSKQEQNDKNSSQDKLQKVYINQKNQPKNVKISSIGVRKLNKQQNQFIFSNFSKNQKRNQNLKSLSEIHILNQGGSQNYINNFIESSGIYQINLINQKTIKNLPSPNINQTSQQLKNQEDVEASNIMNNNEVSIQKSQIYEENDAIQISYYSESLQN